MFRGKKAEVRGEEIKKKIVSQWFLPTHSLAEITKIFLPMKGIKAYVDGSGWGR